MAIVREMLPGDIDAVMRIWLEANLSAHSFVPEEYWRSNLEPVREAIASAEVYVADSGGRVLGFIGLDGGYIAGIFVSPESRGRGVGRQLLERAKARHARLELQVYAENPRARRFYEREGFSVLSEGADSGTGRAELVMAWARGEGDNDGNRAERR